MVLLRSTHGGNTREAAELLGIAPEQILDFSANINPAGMPESLKQALRDNLTLAERYPDADYLRLHQALAQHHQLPAEWIVAGNGETEAIFALVNALAPRKAMVITPGFAEYRRALVQAGCEIVDFRLREDEGWQLTTRLLGALTADLDCLFLCTPNNPTGLLADESLLHAVSARCKALGIALVLDEAFMDFITDREGFIPHLAGNPHLWVLRSLTKFYAIPGLRLGYLLGSDVGKIARIRQAQMPWSINAYAALAGEVILRDSDYQQASWQWLADERPRLFRELNNFSALTVWPGAANFLFLRCDAPEIALQQALLAEHILIRSCANYSGLDERYYRVAVRSAEENDQLIAALNRVFSGTDLQR
ncbi:threonine-phosphate decarboxylase CobD [Salmonella enterica]